MSTTTRLASWIALGLLAAANAPAATFSYHGTLQDAGKPAEGTYDLELTLYSAASGGHVVAGPLTLFEVPVHGGAFHTEADFGPLANLQGNDWLDVKVRAAGSGDPFVALSARSPVTASATASVCPGAWTLVGNTGNPAGSYLGTGDANPLVFDIAGAEVGRFSTDGNLSLRTTPIDAGTELNIGGGPSAAGYANLFMHQSGVNDGIQISVGEATSGGNNANLYIDNYNGSARNRKFEVRGDGRVSINGDPINASTELTVTGTSAAGGANMFMHQNGLNAGIMFSSTDATAGNNNATFALDQYDGTHTWRRMYVARNGRVGFNTLASAGGADFYSTLNVGGNENNPSGSIDLVESDSSSGISIGEYPWDASSNLFLIGRISPPNLTPPFADYTGMAIFGPKFTLLNSAEWDAIDALVVGTPGGADGNGAHLTLGGAWTNGSSRTFKQGFAAIDPTAILDKVVALSISTWQYKNDAAEGRHLGPVAEDFMAAFGLGSNERYISTADEEGVALAAIQGLNARLQAQSDAMRAEKDAEIAELRAKVDAISMRLAALEASKGK